MNTPTSTPSIETQDTNELGWEISGSGYQNWRMEGEPPIMVNPKASTHHKIAWAWGEVSRLNSLAMDVAEHDASPGRRAMAELIVTRLGPVEAMLSHLGDKTSKNPSLQA